MVDIEDSTGTPRVLARLDGTLTGPSSGAPVDVALRYVRKNLAALGLSEGDLATLQEPTTTSAAGVTEVRWRQAVDGIPAADSELRVNVTADGRVLNVLGAPAPDLNPDTTPALSAGEALRAVQDAVGVHRAMPRDRGPAGATQATEYADGTDAALTLYNERLAWRVTYHAASDAVYDAFVDAETGRVIKRANLVKSAAGDTLVWERYPGAPLGGTALPKNLVTLGYLPANPTTLDGPNVRAFSDLDDDGALDAPDEQIAPDPGNSFAFALATAFPGTGCSATHPCSWSGTGTTWTTNRRQNGVQAFYLANRFHDYLKAAPINFNVGAFENGDRLILQTDDGAATGTGGAPDNDHINNANMLTPPDGQSPVMQMYLWGGDSTLYRDVNSGDDASILYHEYTHGLSNRLVKDASGAGALNSPQAGAMGEGWGDWYAKDFLVKQFPSLDTAAPGQVYMGEYTDLGANAIRRQALDCPVTGATASQCPAGAGPTGPGGFTYADFGRVRGEPDVHGDGEIWAQTLWDLRTVIGSQDAARLITQGMRLSPPEPSFLDMRNAILLADQAAGATFRAQIWGVFAGRGMGFFASTIDGSDVAPLADFSTPPAPGDPRGRISGRVTDSATGQPISGARAAVGGLENGPDALVAIAGGAGAFAIERAPAHGYSSFLFKAPGYETLVQPIMVPAGGQTDLVTALRRNWASRSGGASATGDNTYAGVGCGVASTIDQSAATGWSTDVDATPSSMIVTLPQPVNVTAFGVDPSPACGDPVDAATQRIQIETSANGTTYATAFDGNLRRPTSHAMQEIAAPAAGVRFVRVTLHSNFGNSFYRDLTEFAVYTGPAASMIQTVTPAPAPEPIPTATATPLPTATATPVPTVTPQPRPAAPSFVLRASGKRSARFTVACRADCRITGRLEVAKAVARRLGLGRSRVAGTITRNAKTGTRTFTLKLSSKAARALRRGKPRSFRGTLRVSASYAGGTAASKSRAVVIRR